MFEGNRLSVSVITPSLNQGRYIRRTLQSVAAQNWPALEHYVVDGGSTDETLSVLKAGPPGMRWVSGPDRGQAHAVNKGIAATTGDVIAWINSDDVYYPGAIEKAVSFLSEHPEVDVVFGEADHIDADNAVIEAYPTEPFDLPRLFQTCFICQPAAFFRRRCVGAYGLLDERLHYCMDYEYWLRLARAGARFSYLPSKLAGSRLHQDTKTLRARAAVHREINDMLRRMLGAVPDLWLWNYAHVTVGMRTDRDAHPTRFSLEVNAATVLAALRWNHGISGEMRATLLERARRALLRRIGRRVGG